MIFLRIPLGWVGGWKISRPQQFYYDEVGFYATPSSHVTIHE
jgi:hypothetical protein